MEGKKRGAWAGTGTQPVRHPFKKSFPRLAHLPHQGMQSGALPWTRLGLRPETTIIGLSSALATVQTLDRPCNFAVR